MALFTPLFKFLLVGQLFLLGSAARSPFAAHEYQVPTGYLAFVTKWGGGLTVLTPQHANMDWVDVTALRHDPVVHGAAMGNAMAPAEGLVWWMWRPHVHGTRACSEDGTIELTLQGTEVRTLTKTKAAARNDPARLTTAAEEQVDVTMASFGLGAMATSAAKTALAYARDWGANAHTTTNETLAVAYTDTVRHQCKPGQLYATVVADIGVRLLYGWAAPSDHYRLTRWDMGDHVDLQLAQHKNKEEESRRPRFDTTNCTHVGDAPTTYLVALDDATGKATELASFQRYQCDEE